ncbi:MAG: transposase [Trichocoleus desertorum ATA4-8-CV12]|jgi:hypothetical protein|nr:transposase [Trichocoleus desertorum ATA4-8-CV12]
MIFFARSLMGKGRIFNCEQPIIIVISHICFFQPLQGWRHLKVTEQGTSEDFALCMQYLVDVLFPEARLIHVVLDNLVIYLPPYSPDLNRIEKCWAWLKGRIRKQRRNSTSLREAMEIVLKEAAS